MREKISLDLEGGRLRGFGNEKESAWERREGERERKGESKR